MTDADLVGAVVGGKYQVRSKIGTGSMGDVYEAENTATKMMVALKVLRVDDATLAARFLREAKTMSLFQHPNIVELLEVGTHDDGRLFFAAELVVGNTLRVLLEDGPVEPRRALAIVRQVVDALGHAHAMGVVHRDIKPENVMIGAGSDDHVKILDFGVAKLIGDTPAVLGEGTLTITGYGALGTPFYISPEAVLGRALDARADLYSVGVMLFELLAGKPPYHHDDVAVLMRMHAAAPIPKLADRNRALAVTPEIELVLNEALAKKPEMRFKSAAEMIVAIDAAARSLEPLPADAPKPNKSTDVFGALPMKAPAPPAEPSASAPAAFSPTSIPSASQPVQPEPGPPVRRSERRPLPGVTPYTTPVAGTPAVASSPAGPSAPLPPNPPRPGAPVIGVVVPASGAPHDAPLFSPPMPQVVAQPEQPSKLFALAQRHRKYVIAAMGVFVLVIIVSIAVAAGGGKKSEPTGSTNASSSKSTRSELVKAAQDHIAAGLPAKALELLEAEPLGDDAEAYLVLGHAQITSGRRLDGLGAYERAISIADKHRADPLMRAHVERVLETRDLAAVIVALDLATRLEPPLHEPIVKLASSGKHADIRQRAFAIAEREKLVGGVDAVASWALDLAQASSCDERLAAVRKLKRAADPKALPALKRARSHRCVEREAAEAITAIQQQQPAKP